MSYKSALIGYTGFVGSNLNQQFNFSYKYNSKNIEDIKNQEFDIVYCAGIQAVVWWANQNPEEDLSQINRLLDMLKTVKAKKFVLISTVDVYPNPQDVDENTDLTQRKNVPYGENRLGVEKFVKENFSDHHIIRLPGLFGPGLKKNVIFDLLNQNYLHALNEKCMFQYYDLKNIYKDIQTVIRHDVKLQNFATEPISTREIIDKFFSHLNYGDEPGAFKNYHYKTINSKYWGNTRGYIYDKSEVLDQLKNFIENYKK